MLLSASVVTDVVGGKESSATDSDTSTFMVAVTIVRSVAV